MDDEHEIADGELTSRAPTQEDFVTLCARLNELKARYIVIGGFGFGCQSACETVCCRLFRACHGKGEDEARDQDWRG